MSLTVSKLYQHPIKSVAGIEVSRLELDEFGPTLDRRWMLVDPDGMFVSQRSDPRLSLARVTVEAESLRVASEAVPEALLVPWTSSGPLIRVRHITDDVHTALHVDANADAWFSELLGRPVRLVRFAGERTRPINSEYSSTPRFTSLNDGFPLLVASEASLEHLNAKLEARGEPNVNWAPFRPNVVIAGYSEPHAEDGWRRLRIGSVELELVKACARCSIVMTDPRTATREPEPMRTLATYRTVGGKVLFAQNAIHDGPGTLERGQVVTVLE